MIDTHLHLLYPEKFGYAWTGELPLLREPHTLDEYATATEGTPLEGALFMEVDVDEGQGFDEAAFFCELVEKADNPLLGVIAAARPENADFPGQMERLDHPAIKGIRRVLHTKADELCRSRLFRDNLNRLAQRGWNFDLCMLQRQLPIGLELVRACPELTIVIDHCGVPDIAGNNAPGGEGYQSWDSAMRSLAGESNTVCKLSGISAYAGESQRSVEGLWPYFDVVLDAFGPDRIVWGSDWPVCRLAVSLKRWVDLTKELLDKAGLGNRERSALLAENARRVYRLA